MSDEGLTQEMAVQELQATQHDISLSEASNMVRRFKQFRKQLSSTVRKQSIHIVDSPKFPDSLAYNSAALFRLMKVPGCIGVRCYPAIDDEQQFRLVIVAIDELGNNILPGSAEGNLISARTIADPSSTGILDEGQASPPYPAPENDL